MRPFALPPPRLDQKPLIRGTATLRRTASPVIVPKRPLVAGVSLRTPVNIVAEEGGWQLNARPNPYVDFSRTYTVEGGIAILYKDLDTRLRLVVMRVLLWVTATALAAACLVWMVPGASIPLRLGCFAVVAVANWLIVSKPVEIMRSIEIRPDCMIIEGTDVFWRDSMELGFPSFKNNAEGDFMLSGVYGTRHVEYLALRRFDPNDRSPEVLAAHLAAAMQQQWIGVAGPG